MADNSTVTPKRKRGPGKPFTKDDPRINRTGRPKLSDEVKIELAALWPDAVTRLRELMTNDNPTIALKAVEIALNRALGTASDKGVIGEIDAAEIETGNWIPSFDDDHFGLKPETVPNEGLIDKARERIDNSRGEIN